MNEIDKLFENWDEEEFKNSCDHFWVMQYSVNESFIRNKNNSIFKGYKCIE